MAEERIVAEYEGDKLVHRPMSAAENADRDAIEAAASAERVAEENATTLRDRAEQALENLEGAWAGWANLTAAQKDAALKLNVRVTVALARLVLRKLDKT